VAQQYHNPFASIDLIAPIKQRNFYDLYCQTGGRASVDQSPFPRMVDFWFAGLSLAARKQLKLVNLAKPETFKFIDGSIFDSDSWRVQVVMLVAIAVDGNMEIVSEPRRMMTIANGLAAAGVPHIVEMLREGNQDPIWNLSDSLDEILRER
jgi:hypothetical protein